MRTNSLTAVLIPVVLAALLSGGAARQAAAEPNAEDGRQYYTRYCGSCHGATGNGKGPVASVLKTPPADLTRLSEKYGLPLPEKPLLAYIDGRTEVDAHGPREMPVWGRRLRLIESTFKEAPTEEDVQNVLRAIFLHLEAIQPGGPRAPRTTLP
ncbi:MAG: c-type cytochrome [Myxococcota bacterium]